MYKALKSFSGLVSMTKGQLKDIKDENIKNDLLRCGYIEEVKEVKKEVKNEIKKEVVKVEEEIKEEVKKVTSKKKNKTKK